ncbi:hypothetical protein SAMN05880566_1135 [Janthinobacterium sp. TND4EL3]|nr:hypothetical protein SAMN05880566_1135 [Janthinobacterium sp. TND4EL3]
MLELLGILGVLISIIVKLIFVQIGGTGHGTED